MDRELCRAVFWDVVLLLLFDYHKRGKQVHSRAAVVQISVLEVA